MACIPNGYAEHITEDFIIAANNTIPIRRLFSNPVFSRAQISPDGRSVAYLSPWEERLNVFARSLLDARYKDAKQVTRDSRRNVEGFCWTPDSRSLLFVQDRQGDENWHLYRADLDADTPELVNLTPYPGVRVMGLELLASVPGKAYVQMNHRSPELIDLYEIDLASGKLTTLAESPNRYVRWLIAPNALLYAFVIDERGDHELARYDEGAFTAIAKFPGRDYPFGPMPILMAQGDNGLIVGSNTGSDHTYLSRIDLITGKETVVDRHPTASLDTPRPEADPRFPSSLIVNNSTGALLAARYLADRQEIRVVEPAFAPVLERLRQLSPAPLGHATCDATGQKWVVEFSDDRRPGTTWFYDHETGNSEIIGSRFPRIDPNRLSPVQPIFVAARDGLILPCYLTLPVGDQPSGLPAVLLVHGGPWYRDACVYDPEVQFFASRGYAVLQVNFRGSTGYGKSFMQAAIGEFGGRMHDDLVDGLDWLVRQGIADPSRVAIYGCSYGGYSALVGASQTPDCFAAAIDYSGMCDLRGLVEGAVPFIRETLVNNYLAYIGDPEDPAQNQKMLNQSPVSRLDQIVKPLLVIHGANDVRVAESHAAKIVDVVKACGVEVEYLLNPNEGHWFINQDSNFELYATIESFLSRHIGGRKP